jgi:hypothetical protein
MLAGTLGITDSLRNNLIARFLNRLEPLSPACRRKHRRDGWLRNGRHSQGPCCQTTQKVGHQPTASR